MHRKIDARNERLTQGAGHLAIGIQAKAAQVERIEDWLVSVREIREEKSPGVEDVARRKLWTQDPVRAEDWDPFRNGTGA